MTKDQIRNIFLNHGFTVKEGETDLKPYVFEAANMLLLCAEVENNRLIREHIQKQRDEEILNAKPEPTVPWAGYNIMAADLLPDRTLMVSRDVFNMLKATR
jgi:hypothetical protein